jgi:hypothetical protein
MAFTLTRAKAQKLTDVLYLGSIAFFFVAIFLPPLVIMLIGLFAGTVPTEAEGGILGFADSYPAFNPQSWLMWVPAVVMLFLAFWTIPLSSAFVGAPGIEGESVVAALLFGVAFVLFLLRALFGLFRLVPRSWRVKTSSTPAFAEEDSSYV